MTETQSLKELTRGTLNVELSSECSLCLTRGLGILISMIEKNPKRQLELYSEAFQVLSEGFKEKLKPASIVNHLNRRMASLTGIEDPYFELKLKSIQHSREAMSLIEKKLQKYRGYQRLRGALAASITGNLIDFHSAGHTPDLQSLEKLFNQIIAAGFAIDDSAMLWNTLTQSPGSVLLLADNAGESLFDIPLLRLFENHEWHIEYCVKSGPIVNDATFADIEGTEIEDMTNVVSTGARAIGAPVDEVSERFLDQVMTSNLILSKGQANLETFPEIQQLYDVPTFYVLRAKCPHIAKTLHVETGTNIVLRV
ncbi:MAG: DUF89 family protein [Candidatus Thorarchaeota archaeon]|nr:DUF89 family protein [Candidatus Thorarchaeota archaeon]